MRRAGQGTSARCCGTHLAATRTRCCSHRTAAHRAAGRERRLHRGGGVRECKELFAALLERSPAPERRLLACVCPRGGGAQTLDPLAPVLACPRSDLEPLVCNVTTVTYRCGRMRGGGAQLLAREQRGPSGHEPEPRDAPPGTKTQTMCPPAPCAGTSPGQCGRCTACAQVHCLPSGGRGRGRHDGAVAGAWGSTGPGAGTRHFQGAAHRRQRAAAQ